MDYRDNEDVGYDYGPDRNDLGENDILICEYCNYENTASSRNCLECDEPLNDPEEREDEDFDDAFADPGGRSALRAASAANPRNLPCPTCDAPNRLTPRDRELGYQCDTCADQSESGGY